MQQLPPSVAPAAAPRLAVELACSTEFDAMPFGRFDLDLAEGQLIYVFVDDVDAHHASVSASGAKIWAEPHEHFGNNRQYTMSDPGGQRWTFATPQDDAKPAGS